MTTTITPELKTELTSIVQEAMDQRERKKLEDKQVFNRVCKNMEALTESFTFTTPSTYQGSDGRTHVWDKPAISPYQIESAICVLLRCVYQVDAKAKLPSEKESEMHQFMADVFSLMENLRKAN